MVIISGIFYALIGLGFLVLIHELGHLIVARWTGIKVEAFSIFFGKPLYKFNWKNIEWRIGWIPFGGYCKMKGQDDFAKLDSKGEEDEIKSKDETNDDSVVEASDDKDGFYKRPPWARLLTVLAGPVFNVILGMILLTGIFFVNGEWIRLNDKITVKPKYKKELSHFQSGDVIEKVDGVAVSQLLDGKEVKTWNKVNELLMKGIHKENQIITVNRNGALIDLDYQLDKELRITGELGFTLKEKVLITGVLKDTPAEKFGLLKGDFIISIDDQPVNYVSAVYNIINSKKDNTPHKFIVLRNEKEIEINVISKLVETKDNKKVRQVGIGIGVSKTSGYKKNYSLLESIPKGVDKGINLMGFAITQFKILSQLEGETVRKNIGGPIRIFHQLGKTGTEGLGPYITLVAVISILLGVFNLLPIPAVDGGHVVLTLFEMIRRKPLSLKVIQRFQVVGVFIIISLAILITFNDVFNLIF